MTFSSRPRFIKLATLNFLLYIMSISLVLSIVNICNVHVLYKMSLYKKLIYSGQQLFSYTLYIIIV